MSAFGTKQTWQRHRAMSAFGGKADIVVAAAADSGVYSVRPDYADMLLLDPKIGCGLSAALALNLVLDGLSLVERTQPSPLDSRDVDKHIFATAP